MSKRVVTCRCEDVLETELTEAIEAGNEDLESLKRYTGFGTGVCQGKSCVAHVGALLARLRPHARVEPFTARPPLAPVPMALLAAPDGPAWPALRGPRSRRREGAPAPALGGAAASGGAPASGGAR
jgi:sarcosine oxidase subunit beta